MEDMGEKMLDFFSGKYFEVDDPIGKVIVVVAGISLLGLGIYQMVKEDNKAETDKFVTCNIITTDDGKTTRTDDVTMEKTDDEYNYIVKSQKNNELVIYVYGDDETQRDNYTSFIESNIYVLENNGEMISYLDESNLTEDNFNAYVKNLNENEKGTSRVRS